MICLDEAKQLVLHVFKHQIGRPTFLLAFAIGIGNYIILISPLFWSIFNGGWNPPYHLNLPHSII